MRRAFSQTGRQATGLFREPQNLHILSTTAGPGGTTMRAMSTAPVVESIHAPDRYRELALVGARRVLPFLAGVAPLGFAIGAAGAASGLAPIVAWSSAVVVYGGSIQLVVLHLVDSGAAPAVLVMAALLATVPRCLYALVIGPGFGPTSVGRRAVVAYLLVEPSFAVSAEHQTDQPRPAAAEVRAVYLGAGLVVFVTWIAVTGLGAVVGGQLPTGFGLELLVPVMMLALAFGSDRTRASWAAAVSAGAVSIVAAGLPHHLGFMAAVAAGVGTAMAVERRWESGS